MESLVEYFLQNHDKLLYVIAGLSLVLELTVMGLSGPLLFFSVGCAITGLFVSFGFLSDWEYEALSVGMSTSLCALLLWKPLRKFQGPARVSDSSSDMIGQVVPVNDEVTASGGSIRHSGISWQARLDPGCGLKSLESGMRVEICAVDGNVMVVREPVSN
ncbi:hypothetical protein MNBD_GAMMA09-3597 [hydrothermal vent metagenome]|uniref:NfeD-like C-terminal domain-containing protein n=1 Tax=hydrothermal vent metagenome TaxID=652676 RepID=A0A3B0X3Q4_9ZZZZ